jgi:hypothetical protein
VVGNCSSRQSDRAAPSHTCCPEQAQHGGNQTQPGQTLLSSCLCKSTGTPSRLHKAAADPKDPPPAGCRKTQLQGVPGLTLHVDITDSIGVGPSAAAAASSSCCSTSALSSSDCCCCCLLAPGEGSLPSCVLNATCMQETVRVRYRHEVCALQTACILARKPQVSQSTPAVSAVWREGHS